MNKGKCNKSNSVVVKTPLSTNVHDINALSCHVKEPCGQRSGVVAMQI